ncbi:VWA domain-containing protein [Aliikangiella sp. G2MR2-5]|uniref:VWA domain-containing protein n=1 Tax=Aliikangiella sp. G2MR2-5 TaxID=2788943 RepID=UPI0018AAE299|nr:VWA domain-containing protein [Aliikangiella sp. G2MR2-5]
MSVNLEHFHFIRPLLLLLIPAVFLIVYFLKQKASAQSAWKSVISPHLLKFLTVSAQNGHAQKLNSGLLLTLITILVIAVSGPSFRQKPVPVFNSENAQVVLLDLSLSMDATDIKPSRLERAKFKLIDLLKRTDEGSIGLVIYAGDGFVISPLTSDANTIANMVPTLSTAIMPVLGSRPDKGIEKAIDLLKNGRHSNGQIIWLTDGVDEEYVDPIVDSVEQSGYQLSILAIGTEQGAPIPLPNKNGFLKDGSGGIVVPKLEVEYLLDIVEPLDASFVKMTADQSDIDYLESQIDWQAEKDNPADEQEQKISKWIDDGYWLIWAVLLLFTFKLLRNSGQAMLGICLVLLTSGLLPSSNSYAAESPPGSSNSDATGVETTSENQSEPPASPSLTEQLSQGWKDFWYTDNQQAVSAFREGDYSTAAQKFENEQWRATSEFRQGRFESAAQQFSSGKSDKALYNQATALAKANKLEESLKTYEELLKNNPEHEDGLYNKKIVEDLLKQQQENKEQQQDKEQQEKDQKDSEQQGEQDKQNQQEKESEQEKEQQNQQQQEQNQQKQEQKEQAEMQEDDREKSEKDQALEHWLQKIPDDPGGLLRRKMYREYQRRGRKQKEEKLW